MSPAATDPLSRYLEKRGESLRQFALRAAVSHSAVSRYIRGERLPTLDAAEAIETATGGVVPMAYWIRHHNRRRRAA